jgi:amino acid transporter
MTANAADPLGSAIPDSFPDDRPLPIDKGLRAGALSLGASVVIGVASVAPAYSLAATLGFVVVAVGVQSPAIVLLAFVPMLLIAVAYKELNKVDPDCGTTFTWATRAFGPKTGWFGGWGIIVADVLVMASLAQVAGQYGFLLFNANGIGHDATSGWVLLVGVLWIVVMTGICYVGVEVSANIQKALLSIEVVMLVVLSVVALVKVGTGNAPAGHLTPQWSWFNPFGVHSFSAFVAGLILMLFIYWGWDTTVAVNEETADRTKQPGRAAVIATVMLLAIYVVATLGAQAYSGVGDKGIGLTNSDNSGDVLSVLGDSVFGKAWYGTTLTHLLILMVLSSAAASTQTTILPTARTTLSMATYRALPKPFAHIHPKYMSPTFSTVIMGAVSIAFYLAANFVSSGNVIADSVTAVGLMIAFYYGLTGFACTWYFRKTLTHNVRDFFMQGVIPLLGGLILFFAGGWSVYLDWINPDAPHASSYTSWLMQFSPHWWIGGVFIIGFVTVAVGFVFMGALRLSMPAFFKGETLSRETETLVPDVP